MATRTNPKDTLFQLRIKARIDTRTTACRVTVERLADKKVQVRGYSQYRQTDAFVRALAGEIYGADHVSFDLKVLERGAPKFAVINSAVAPLWRNPDASDPETLDSEALYGSYVRVYHREGPFTFIQMADGYVGYCPTASLQRATTEEYLRWKNGPQAVTLLPLQAGDIAIAPGSRFSYEGGSVLLPGGGTLKVSKKQVVLSDPADPKFAKILQERAREFLDSPYLWGGKSVVGIDCSGFVQTLMLQEGVVLPRDASMQCHVGEIVGYLPRYGDLLPGDVMFFMNTNAYVFHVGIFLGDDMYMHSAGKTGPIISSVKKDGQNFASRYDGTYVYARRMHRR